MMGAWGCMGRLGRVAMGLLLGLGMAWAKEIRLLNVSYDPTREFYAEYNVEFARHWKERTGDDVRVRQSHGLPRPSRGRWWRLPG